MLESKFSFRTQPIILGHQIECLLFMLKNSVNVLTFLYEFKLLAEMMNFYPICSIVGLVFSSWKHVITVSGCFCNPGFSTC